MCAVAGKGAVLGVGMRLYSLSVYVHADVCVRVYVYCIGLCIFMYPYVCAVWTEGGRAAQDVAVQ